MKKLVVITGPTGVGKTDLSLEVVKRFNGEVINCDASQFRRKLNIGTAKLDLSKTDVKHHLINIIDPTTSFSIKDFQKLCRNKIDELTNREVLPFLVGGSGLYINAIIGDYDLSDNGRNIELEKEYENVSNQELYKLLETLDYNATLKIPVNNRRRLLRAIELAKAKTPISENQTGINLLYDVLIICMICNREILYDRINQRVETMFANGWIEEVEQLKQEGINIKEISEIGYLEIEKYLNSEISLEEVKSYIKQKTRNYAKRQLTWFKNKMNCEFITMNYQEINVTINEVSELINKFLNYKNNESIKS